MLLLLLILVLVFGFGGYRLGGPERGPYYGGVSIGGILLIVLVLYLLGVIPGGNLNLR